MTGEAHINSGGQQSRSPASLWRRYLPVLVALAGLLLIAGGVTAALRAVPPVVHWTGEATVGARSDASKVLRPSVAVAGREAQVRQNPSRLAATGPRDHSVAAITGHPDAAFKVGAPPEFLGVLTRASFLVMRSRHPRDPPSAGAPRSA